MININSLDNKRVKELVKLRKAGFRKDAGLFIVDGLREIEIALKSKFQIAEVFYCPDFSLEETRLLNKIPAEKQNLVSESVFKKISYKENPDGFLAIIKRDNLNLKKVKLSKNPIIIVLEAVEKPGNLGAIIRTAYAAGVEAIIINDNQTDIFNPNVIRASEGQIFNMQVAVASVSETIDWLKEHKIKSLAASTSGSSSYLEVNLSGPVAIVLGTESDGLSKEWLKLADKKILIPMKKEIDSLNVSVSAAIIVFEAVRQRNIS